MPGDRRHSSAVEIRRIGERAAALTRQLLAFSRRQVLQPTVIDLNSLIDSVTSMLGRVIGENIRLIVEAAPRLWAVKVDAPQIEQVLLNLSVNARDAMPRGGALVIRTENVVLAEGDPILKPDGHAGPFVRLSVTDTGAGIPPDLQAKIFEPFFTTKDRDKGTGLGLASVYGIIRQHGGRITVASEVGKGTQFTIHLPAV